MTNKHMTHADLARTALDSYGNTNDDLPGPAPGMVLMPEVMLKKQEYGFEYGVYYDQDRHAFVMAFTGSNDLRDWGDNVWTYLLGGESWQKEPAIKAYEKLRTFRSENPEYADAGIFLAGHSKGGLNAQLVDLYARKEHGENSGIVGGVTVGSPDLRRPRLRCWQAAGTLCRRPP